MSLIHFERAGTGAQVGTFEWSSDLTWKMVFAKAQSLVQTDLTYGVRLFRGHGGKECHKNDGLVTECPEEPIVIWPLTDARVPELREKLYGDPACLLCTWDLDEMRLLLHLGADPDVTDAQLYTPLMLCTIYSTPEHAKLLLEFGADIHKEEETGCTALELCAQNEDVPEEGPEDAVAMVHVLLDHKADIDRNKGTQKNAMFQAATNAHRDVLQAFLDRGGNINVVDETGMTPLMDAAKGRNPFHIRALLELKADVHATDSMGHTALRYARFCNRSADGPGVVIPILREFGATE